MMTDSIQLIVGLGNPGLEYAATRHNAGAWFVAKLAEHFGGQFKTESKLHAQVAQMTLANKTCRLAIPTTYMNHSGLAVQAVSAFYKVKPENLLIVHDELDLLPGVVKLKMNGGHGGHNGLRDIIGQLGTSDFNRARIGIGHPGSAHQVTAYVLNKPTAEDNSKIQLGLKALIDVMPQIMQGDLQGAMQQLH